jgi:hypothetical protein
MRAGKSASSEGVEQIRERGCPRFGQRTGRSCLGVQLQMGEYLLNHFGIFDAGNDLHGTAAVLAGGDIDIEYPFEPLSPSHGGVALCGRPIYGGVGRLGFYTYYTNISFLFSI